MPPGLWFPFAAHLYTVVRNLRHSSVRTQSIVILDFGAQYSQLIARRIREQNVFSVVLPCTASLDEIRSYSPVGIVLSGGPSSVYDADAPPADHAHSLRRNFGIGERDATSAAGTNAAADADRQTAMGVSRPGDGTVILCWQFGTMPAAA